LFIVRPDVEEADIDKLIEGFSANVTNGGGEVKSVEKMGRRRLAYTVRKFNDGFYILLNIAAEGSLITEIERRLRVSEQVIKFITVRMDEEEKRLAKVKPCATPRSSAAHSRLHRRRRRLPPRPMPRPLLLLPLSPRRKKKFPQSLLPRRRFPPMRLPQTRLPRTQPPFSFSATGSAMPACCRIAQRTTNRSIPLPFNLTG
jgi:ribosomal protein S6